MLRANRLRLTTDFTIACYTTAHLLLHMVQSNIPYLFKFVGNHCKCLEDGVCWSSDGDNPLWTVAFRNIDPCSALIKKKKKKKRKKKKGTQPSHSG